MILFNEYPAFANFLQILHPQAAESTARTSRSSRQRSKRTLRRQRRRRPQLQPSPPASPPSRRSSQRRAPRAPRRRAPRRLASTRFAKQRKRQRQGSERFKRRATGLPRRRSASRSALATSRSASIRATCDDVRTTRARQSGGAKLLRSTSLLRCDWTRWRRRRTLTFVRWASASSRSTSAWDT